MLKVKKWGELIEATQPGELLVLERKDGRYSARTVGVGDVGKRFYLDRRNNWCCAEAVEFDKNV